MLPNLPLACIGLAVLIAAPRRDLRMAGLGAWIVGCAFLASYLAPSGHAKVYAAATIVAWPVSCMVATPPVARPLRG